MGRHAPRFRKVRKTSEKEKWRNPFSVASNVKAREGEIAGKIQNISESQIIWIMKHVFILSIQEFSATLFQILYVFLTLIILLLFKNAMENYRIENEETKVNIFMRFVCHSLATFLASYSHQNQINEQI